MTLKAENVYCFSLYRKSLQKSHHWSNVLRVEDKDDVKRNKEIILWYGWVRKRSILEQLNGRYPQDIQVRQPSLI